MHHFVGYSEEGAAIYKDGCSDHWCALDSYVGQIVDFSPLTGDEDHLSEARDMVVARVGAGMPMVQAAHPAAPTVQSSAMQTTALQSHASPAMPIAASTAPAYANLSNVQAPAAVTATQVQTPAAVPYWACYGRAEGGFYANNPTPGATFEQCAFTREAIQPGEQIAESYYLGPTPYNPILNVAEEQPSGGLLRNIFGAAGRFLTGQWAHGNPGPKCGAPGTPGYAAYLKRKAAAHANAQGGGSSSGGRGGASGGRGRGGGAGGRQTNAATAAKVCARNACGITPCIAKCARAQGITPQQLMQQQQCGGGGGGGGGGGYCGGSCCGGYCCGGYCGPQQGPQQVPPGYCFVPGPPPGQDDQGGASCDYGDPCDDGDYGDCDYCDYGDCCDMDGSYYAGQAPQGLGEGIGGALGGILGMFAGSPELGAPIGAAIGGAIQGAACGGHHGGPPTQIRTYTANGGKVPVHGVVAPDGLFDPATGDMGSPVSIVISQANDILRKHATSGQHFDERTKVGQSTQECSAVQIWDDTPRFAAGALFDDVDKMRDQLEDDFEGAGNWFYDEGDSALKYAVGGGPGAKDYGPYSSGTIQSVIQGLRNAGYDVEGSNPYDVDVKQHGVKLAATVHGDGTVTIAIASSNFYVTHDQVWSKVDPLMPAAG